jgi:hypothetical protein
MFTFFKKPIISLENNYCDYYTPFGYVLLPPKDGEYISKRRFVCVCVCVCVCVYVRVAVLRFEPRT